MKKPEWMIEREERGLPFDLYFAGYGFKDSIFYTADRNMPVLRSQLNDVKELNEYFSHYDSYEDKKLFVDSGAFTAHTKGADLDVDKYIEWMNREDSKITIFAQVDKIPGVFRQPKTREEVLEAPKLSWENYLYMRSKCVSPNKLLPVFHMGEDYKWLRNMLEFTENGNHIPYICLSPANDSGVPGKMKFLYKCYDIIQNSGNPNVKTHLLGFTSLERLELLPAYSADSTRWIQIGINGRIYTPYGEIDLGVKNRNCPGSVFNNLEALSKVKQYVEDLGFDFDTVVESRDEKLKVNIAVFQKWADSYKFKGDLSTYKFKGLF